MRATYWIDWHLAVLTAQLHATATGRRARVRRAPRGRGWIVSEVGV